MRRVAIALAVILSAGAVRAEDCPTEIPDDPSERRAQAKKWFAKGESEARAGNDLAALKAYQCSLAHVPHGFTAYNIAQIAEKIGDLEIAIASYGQYLNLVPDAKDANEVNERLDLLRERLAKVREMERTAAGRTEPTLDKALEKPREEASAIPAPPPPPAETDLAATESRRSSRNYRLIGWITAGSGGALVLGGVLSNVLARGQMDTCYSEYEKDNRSAAESACSNAKPLAYLSYGLIGVGAAAIVAGAVLVFVKPGRDSEVALNVVPGGGMALRWSGRF
ncbi:MAG: hypothetical protein JXP73_06255 [Deltaproteobacteria bacterium]|nr:hypothetical protein [Deltaproteobacteria bacterium]